MEGAGLVQCDRLGSRCVLCEDCAFRVHILVTDKHKDPDGRRRSRQGWKQAPRGCSKRHIALWMSRSSWYCKSRACVSLG